MVAVKSREEAEEVEEKAVVDVENGERRRRRWRSEKEGSP